MTLPLEPRMLESETHYCCGQKLKLETPKRMLHVQNVKKDDDHCSAEDDEHNDGPGALLAVRQTIHVHLTAYELRVVDHVVEVDPTIEQQEASFDTRVNVYKALYVSFVLSMGVAKSSAVTLNRPAWNLVELHLWKRRG